MVNEAASRPHFPCGLSGCECQTTAWLALPQLWVDLLRPDSHSGLLFIRGHKTGWWARSSSYKYKSRAVIPLIKKSSKTSSRHKQHTENTVNFLYCKVFKYCSMIISYFKPVVPNLWARTSQKVHMVNLKGWEMTNGKNISMPNWSFFGWNSGSFYLFRPLKLFSFWLICSEIMNTTMW